MLPSSSTSVVTPSRVHRRLRAAHGVAVLSLTGLGLAIAAGARQDVAAPSSTKKPIDPPATQPEWVKAEEGILAHHVQLTFSERFLKAGESYFSPDNSKVIFQAVEQPAAGKAPDDFYAMFVADVVRDPATKRIAGLTNYKRISPPESSNTCGWFHPTEPNVVIFATTLKKPSHVEQPGFQRGTGKYIWPFPKEMRIVRCDLTKADGTAATLEPIVGDGSAYVAECSISPDGRHLLYSSQESNEGDLFVLDLKSGAKHRIVTAHGYDGGPFFSPDGKRITYRSDRLGDRMLQIFVAELAFNGSGEIVGIEREYQLTDETCVNWCPFWTTDGRRLVFASGELGETNFEIYMIDADPGDLSGSTGTIKYGTAKRRLTHFEHAAGVPASDVLPAFSTDGAWMIWSSRRGEDNGVHLWAAEFTLNPDAPWKTLPPIKSAPTQRTNENQIVVTDPDSGRILIYDMRTHTLSEYNPRTHELTQTDDPADAELFTRLHEELQQQ